METEEEKEAREAQEAEEAAAAAREEDASQIDDENAQSRPDDTETDAESEKKPEAEAKAEAATEEVSVQIGDDKPPVEEKAPGWVREVRQRNRDLEKKNRELEAKLAGQQQAVKVSAEPKMSDPDIDYDEDKFKARYAAHVAEKNRVAEEEKRLIEAQKKEQDAWQGKLDAYGTAKTAIKVADFDEAESLVQETLSEKQQAILIKGAKNPALLIYALGKNPAKLKEVAALGDLVEFAATVFRDVESQLKVTKKAPPPAPERKVEGTGAKSGLDSTLDKLRAEAERTGDYTKVTQYRREKQAA